MRPSSFRLPGVAFEVQPPAPEAILPRMDVAAFVGFAASGPLHTPVPVEDPARFREIFGPDPELAWDEERGVMERAHLGAAVEAFFRNGGRRCWIVRVAGRRAWTHRFLVPGLAAADGGGTGGSALALARSAGSWADGLRVGTRLVRELLPVDDQEPGWIDVAVPTERVVPGDLLETVVAAGSPAYLLVEQVISRRRGTRLHVAAVSPPPVPGSPPDSPPAGPSIHRLRFELLVWEGKRLAARFSDLAFSERHPRFWGLLPTDEDLFRSRAGRIEPPLPESVVTLRAEAASPRFPLAAPAAPAALYLPVGMGVALDPVAAAEPIPDSAMPGTALARNGLAELGAHLFFDRDLLWAQLGSLLGEAEHRYYRLEEPLFGLHALLPVEEATLIAIPDAAHRGWTRDLPPRPNRLAAPVLDPVPEPDAFGRVRITWSSVPGADRYLLQRSELPDLADELPVFDGDETAARVPLSAGCPRSWFFRVRAFRGGEASPWSATRGAVVPPQDFIACAEEPVSEVSLSVVPGSPPPPELLLSWGLASIADESADNFELQEAFDADFESARQLALSPQTSFDLPAVLDTVRYVRVRARRGERIGPWSNTVVAEPAGQGSYVLRPLAELDPTESSLLAVHRALLRFCAARSDLLALLALPAHFREEDVQAHLGALIPAYGEPAGSAFDGVPPLTDFETGVLGFGALFHPWFLWTAGEGATDPRRVPPEGAMAGLLARRALGPGAWIAPANQPLAGVVGLEPPFGQAQWRRLAAFQVNLLRLEPRGFLTLGADTLSRSEELRPIPVRRLLTLIRRLALREGATWVFEPHDAGLRGLVRHRFERLLSDLYVRGAFAGDVPAAGFRVVVDESVNPPESVDLGRLVVELRVAPSRPLSFLRVRLVQTGPEQLAVQEV